ncbi:MAG: DUF924 family protein [Wenzhouxiangellaceae bacterium]
MMPTAQNIIDYWFGNDDDDAQIAKRQAELWWSKNDDVDSEIKQRFEPLTLAAEAGELDDWLGEPQGRLALILLTDQFPRNMYRDTPDAFRFDPLARQLMLDGLEQGADQALRPIHRLFYYLPLEHSENLAHQQRCVALFRELADAVSADQKPTFTGFIDFAVRHHDIIERFGRFPHRNRILGRQSTAEETEFLKQPNSSF